MNLNRLTVSAPYTHDNLTVFLLSGPDDLDGSQFIPLQEALESKSVVVHETGSVGTLEIENLSNDLDLFIQAGDVVKGGRQDRTLGVDFVLPSKSGRVPIPSFCVESGRWSQRSGEASGSFSTSDSYLASKALRLAAKLSQSQQAVWEQVAASQAHLSESVKERVYAEMSPTSYQLSMEHPEVQSRKAAYREALSQVIEKHPEALGYAFAINGEINTADAYGSRVLFRKLWNKLLDAAVVEAVGEARLGPAAASGELTVDSVRQWITEAEEAELVNRQEVPPRVRVETRRKGKTVVFDTLDNGLGDVILHKNMVAN